MPVGHRVVRDLRLAVLDQVLQARQEGLAVSFEAQQPQGSQDARDAQPVVIGAGENAAPALEIGPGADALLVPGQAQKGQKSLEGARQILS